MRLKIEGAVGKQEILEAVAQLLNTLEESGAEEFRFVNLYLNPMQSGETVKPIVNGEEADILFKSTMKHHQKCTNKSGESITKCITGLTSKDINIDNSYKPEIMKIELRAMKNPAAKKNQDRQKRREKEAAERAERQAQLDQRRKADREFKAKQKVIENQCINSLKTALALTNDQYNTGKSSSGWLKTRKGIEQYTSTLDVEQVFRITMKRGHGEQGKVYLFNEAATIIFESAD
ncbi:hypothetical protein OTK49_02525 [Vibrio coralliirubri]|uniref:hypothetical protein n=1 Tax=Vibrio coralliirubri TaxID=1516159 RepID=UPI002283BA4A|nr:hypothetical protein [Vibrio coralliirubri]MCY9861392.1 hypothetical protein [Vibrio coralliirubri]